LALALALALPAGAGPATDAQAKKSKRQPYTLLFGTVFDEAGRLVRGAKVGVRAKEGKGRWESQTDQQGEFAVHLPTTKAVYTVEAKAPGLEPGRREVEVAGEDRVDVVLQLKRP
jgi:protocatechuate 3,4-dioxygenase beta subunit